MIIPLHKLPVVEDIKPNCNKCKNRNDRCKDKNCPSFLPFDWENMMYMNGHWHKIIKEAS